MTEKERKELYQTHLTPEARCVSTAGTSTSTTTRRASGSSAATATTPGSRPGCPTTSAGTSSEGR